MAQVSFCAAAKVKPVLQATVAQRLIHELETNDKPEVVSKWGGGLVIAPPQLPLGIAGTLY